VNGYEDVDRNMFFKLKDGDITTHHNAEVAKEQCSLDVITYSFFHMTINEWNNQCL